MQEKISRRRFIHLGTALGVGAAGSSVLAACGGGSGESGGGGSGGGSGNGSGSGYGGGGSGTTMTKPSGKKGSGSNGAQASGGQAIAQTSQVAPGSALKFKDSGSPAILVHLKSGEFVAYSAVCTHQGCTVAYSSGQLVCPCHGSVFDPANGAAVVNGPAQRPLPQIPIEVRGGEILKA